LIYLFRDDLVGEERLADLRQAIGPPDVQSLNVTMLDGVRLTLSELRTAIEAFPFLSERRLVVVRKLFGTTSPSEGEGETQTRRGRADADREREFLGYLPHVPSFADLVFVVDPEMKANHALAKAVRDARGEVLFVDPPTGEALGEWIQHRVRSKGGRVAPAAVAELASLTVDNLRELDQTLELLVIHSAERPISVEDVRALVRRSRESSVFTLVDAVGARDRRAAIESLRLLLDGGEAPIYLLVMLARQIRMLLLANEAMARGEDVGAALKAAPWVARKVAQQARTFDIERCRTAYAKMIAADAAIKTGQSDERVAVELLVLELTEP
jgi:DNA polymerase III subunit delta